MNQPLRVSESAALAIHTMSLLARHPTQRLGASEIANALDASVHTQAKVMQRLVRAGLLRAARGPGGGFQLAQPATETSVLAIFEAVDGPIKQPGCLMGHGPCKDSHCLLGGLVHDVHDLVRDRFAATSLADLSKSMRLEPSTGKPILPGKHLLTAKRAAAKPRRAGSK